MAYFKCVVKNKIKRNIQYIWKSTDLLMLTHIVMEVLLLMITLTVLYL